MRTYKGAKVNFKALDGGGQPVTFSGHLTLWDRGHCSQCTGNWVTARASLFIVEKRKITPAPGIKPQFFSIMPRYFTD
jgi:hypothetical protein